MKLKDKISIVTGAGRGIGEAIAVRYGKGGSKVVVSDIEETGSAISEKIRENGGDSIFVKADISKPQDIDALVEKTLTEYGTVDILVNNAGVAVLKPIEDCDLEDWDTKFTVWI